MYSLIDVLPCDRCSINIKRHLEEIAIDDYIQSAERLLYWTFLLHNEVNKETGKDMNLMPSWMTVKSIYMSSNPNENCTESCSDSLEINGNSKTVKKQIATPQFESSTEQQVQTIRSRKTIKQVLSQDNTIIQNYTTKQTDTPIKSKQITFKSKNVF